MLISVRHVTRYRYAEPVSYTIQSLRLTPASFTGQRVLDWQVRAGGAKPAAVQGRLRQRRAPASPSMPGTRSW